MIGAQYSWISMLVDTSPIHDIACTKAMQSSAWHCLSSCSSLHGMHAAVLYMALPVQSQSCTWHCLFIGSPVHGIACTESVLYMALPVQSQSCTWHCLYTVSPVHGIAYTVAVLYMTLPAQRQWSSLQQSPTWLCLSSCSPLHGMHGQLQSCTWHAWHASKYIYDNLK